MLEVLHRPERSRYELVDDGTLLGIVDYVEEGSTLVLTHAEVDPSRRGHGLGAVLVEGTLGHIRAAHQRVVPQCWFVAEFLEAHPEHADLLA